MEPTQIAVVENEKVKVSVVITDVGTNGKFSVQFINDGDVFW